MDEEMELNDSWRRHDNDTPATERRTEPTAAAADQTNDTDDVCH